MGLGYRTEQEVGWQVYKSLCSGGEADAHLVTREKECPCFWSYTREHMLRDNLYGFMWQGI